MLLTGIFYEDCLFLHDMSSLAVGRATVDSTFVIQATAKAIPFDHLVTHLMAHCVSGLLVARGEDDVKEEGVRSYSAGTACIIRRLRH